MLTHLCHTHLHLLYPHLHLAVSQLAAFRPRGGGIHKTHFHSIPPSLPPSHRWSGGNIDDDDLAIFSRFSSSARARAAARALRARACALCADNLRSPCRDLDTSDRRNIDYLRRTITFLSRLPHGEINQINLQQQHKSTAAFVEPPHALPYLFMPLCLLYSLDSEIFLYDMMDIDDR